VLRSFPFSSGLAWWRPSGGRRWYRRLGLGHDGGRPTIGHVQPLGRALQQGVDAQGLVFPVSAVEAAVIGESADCSRPAFQTGYFGDLTEKTLKVPFPLV